MKTKNIFSIHIDGPDGVGKSTLFDLCVKRLGFRFTLHDRGDLSNYVFARKFNRFYCPSERHQSTLIVYLHCDEDVLAERIKNRADAEHWSMTDTLNELTKIADVKAFDKAYESFVDDDCYHIFKIDTTHLQPEQVFDEFYKKLTETIASLPVDDVITPWNEMYKRGAESIGLSFCSRDNQPYINNVAFMSESTLHNGVYEQFNDKSYPDNLIFMRGYTVNDDKVSSIQKSIDFAYVINSKVKRRPEVYDYYEAFKSHSKNCLISKTLSDRYPEWPAIDRLFGDEFVYTLAKAKAVVYCGRDLAYLKLQTARLYEAIIANQIVFVDALSDVDNDILNQIHGRTNYAQLLRVTPQNVCEVYDALSDNDIAHILRVQREWYNSLMNTVKGGLFEC